VVEMNFATGNDLKPKWVVETSINNKRRKIFFINPEYSVYNIPFLGNI
jgi:hypothetical protein